MAIKVTINIKEGMKFSFIGERGGFSMIDEEGNETRDYKIGALYEVESVSKNKIYIKDDCGFWSIKDFLSNFSIKDYEVS